MRRCLLLAQKGEGRVSPNPLVGAAVVRNGKIIGEGFHKKFGGPHAEANALRGVDAAGATLYVSLEPCCKCNPHKKTPACVPLIIKSGVSRVVIAAKDANQHVHGAQELKAEGLQVEAGLLGDEAKRQNEAYFKAMRKCGPFVIVKMAQSANGKIGIKGKSNVRITGKEFDHYTQRLRNRCDSVLVGINTVLEDDPRLTCRIPGGRNPARIILDSRLRIPMGAKALRNAKRERVIIATSQLKDEAKAKALSTLGATVVVCGKNKASLKVLLKSLPQLGILSVLIEGGASVVRSALAGKLADRAVVAVSLKKITDKGAVSSPFTPSMLQKFEKRDIGQDTVYEGCL